MFEDLMNQVLDTVHALIKEVISSSVASWQAAPKDKRLPRLKALVSELQRFITKAHHSPACPYRPPAHLEALKRPLIHILTTS